MRRQMVTTMCNNWHKYRSWYFKIVSNFKISLMVFMSNITTNHAITYTNLPSITRTMLQAPDKTCSLWLYFFQFNLNTVSNTVYISDFQVFMLLAPTVHLISGYLLRTAHNSDLIFDFPWRFELSGVDCIGIWDPGSTYGESRIQYL